MMDDQLTPERIAKHYSACLDSVWVISEAIANPDEYTSDDTAIDRNVQHLEIMLNADFWTDEDMTPITAAIQSGLSALGE